MWRQDLKTYWRYFLYVLEHKKNVFIECLKTGHLLHGITHDLSKFLPSEFFGYANKFYGGDYAYKFFEVEYGFEESWLHHQNRNKHHWDYWVKADGHPVPMPRKYVEQMIIDWKAMGRKFGDTAQDFYLKKGSKMVLHTYTRKIVEDILGVVLKEEGNKMKVTEFVQALCKAEGGEKEVDIAQASQLIKIADDKLNGKLYEMIRELEE